MKTLHLLLLDLWIDFLSDQRRRVSLRLANAYEKRDALALEGLWRAAK